MDGSEVSLRDCDCGHWTGCNAKPTDEALIGELVKRGVLTLRQECPYGFEHVGSRCAEPSGRFVSRFGEPVGSVSEGEG